MTFSNESNVAISTRSSTCRLYLNNKSNCLTLSHLMSQCCILCSLLQLNTVHYEHVDQLLIGTRPPNPSSAFLKYKVYLICYCRSPLVFSCSVVSNQTELWDSHISNERTNFPPKLSNLYFTNIVPDLNSADCFNDKVHSVLLLNGVILCYVLFIRYTTTPTSSSLT